MHAARFNVTHARCGLSGSKVSSFVAGIAELKADQTSNWQFMWNGMVSKMM
jgi:hypothetical protein